MSGGDEDDEGGGESATPSTLDYLMHGVTILWKVLFAFVPPTGKFCSFQMSNERSSQRGGVGGEEGGEVGGGAASGTRKLCLSTGERI